MSAELDKRSVRGLAVALEVFKSGRGLLPPMQLEQRVLAAAKIAVANSSLQYDPRELALREALLAVEEISLECRQITLEEQRAAREGVATARPEIYEAKVQILGAVICALNAMRDPTGTRPTGSTGATSPGRH